MKGAEGHCKICCPTGERLALGFQWDQIWNLYAPKMFDVKKLENFVVGYAYGLLKTG
ncbi:hypothetical protein SK128_013785 [Halocaridina rubra]|uniref:Uncharacterized protein n=1 Tax=Halocaridina rubra TaxID=373956 RepID=A0AAN8XEX6_HALRR